MLAAALVAACTPAVQGPGVAPAPVSADRPRGAVDVTPRVLALKNPGFEEEVRGGARCANGWSCTVHADPAAFRFFAVPGASGGNQAICTEFVKKEPWAIVAQGTYDRTLPGTRLRYTLAVRLEGVSGQGAGPWASVQRAGLRSVVHQKLLKQTAGWETHVLEFDVPDNATVVEVGLMLRGTGRACLDDARLEILHASKSPV